MQCWLNGQVGLHKARRSALSNIHVVGILDRDMWILVTKRNIFAFCATEKIGRKGTTSAFKEIQ